jgi:hypothetical protein
MLTQADLTKCEGEATRVFDQRGKRYHPTDALEPQWHVPAQAELDMAESLLEAYLAPALTLIADVAAGLLCAYSSCIFANWHARLSRASGCL